MFNTLPSSAGGLCWIPGWGTKEPCAVIVAVQSLNHVQLFATPWTVARRAPLSMGFSRQEYWSGLPCPSPRDLPDPGVKSASPTLHVDSLPTELPWKSTFIKLNWQIFKKKKSLVLSLLVGEIKPTSSFLCFAKNPTNLPCFFPPSVPHSLQRST